VPSPSWLVQLIHKTETTTFLRSRLLHDMLAERLYLASIVALFIVLAVVIQLVAH
jgi:hypothetical protein